MATCAAFQTQLSSILEVLVKAAVAEISKLVEDKCACLHLEIARRQGENEALRRRLLLMESSRAELQPGFDQCMDRGTCVKSDSNNPADFKFSAIEGATVSFTIKEESPNETLWISDSAGLSGAAMQYPAQADAPESQRLKESHQLNRSDVSRPQTSEFGDMYGSGRLTADGGGGGGGLHFTVKAEKEEDQSGFRHDECQHAGGKQAELAAEYCMDERENQLWSSIIEGSDIEAGFPDFSSVVDEYSSAFPDHSDAPSTAKLAGVRHLSAQKPNNGAYSEFQKDLQQASGFHPQVGHAHHDRQREGAYEARNPSHVAHARHSDEQKDRDGGGGGGGEDRPLPIPSHGAFTPGGFPGHKALSGMARSYVCSQCGKSFGRLHQFKLHHQSHKRKRAFWCTVCGKNFQCSSHLSIHHRTHTGEKPYGCGQCGKRFTQQSSLRVHQRTHSGERPYSCTLCGKTFILMHHLKRHRIIHTHS